MGQSWGRGHHVISLSCYSSECLFQMKHQEIVPLGPFICLVSLWKRKANTLKGKRNWKRETEIDIDNTCTGMSARWKHNRWMRWKICHIFKRLKQWECETSQIAPQETTLGAGSPHKPFWTLCSLTNLFLSTTEGFAINSSQQLAKIGFSIWHLLSAGSNSQGWLYNQKDLFHRTWPPAVWKFFSSPATWQKPAEFKSTTYVCIKYI